MKSRTKPEISDKTIRTLFAKAEIYGVENIAPLGAGEYNSVYAVDAGEKAYAVKIAPSRAAKILTYEQQMMAQEVYYYSLMANRASIRVPEIYYSDFSRTEIPSEYFIMERLNGTQIDQTELNDSQKQAVERELAAMVARLHSVKNDQFGYRQNQLFENWFLALQAMVNNLLIDCQALGHRSKRGERLLEAVRVHQAVLDKVDSRLVNFDIWPANIFCEWDDGEPKLAWIDPERCMWGDRIADFVCLAPMKMSLDQKTETIKAYNRVADQPIEIGREERIRFALMLGYLALIMEVEKFARYPVFYFGYWRNVLASRVYYSNCFQQLAELSN